MALFGKLTFRSPCIIYNVKKNTQNNLFWGVGLIISSLRVWILPSWSSEYNSSLSL